MDTVALQQYSDELTLQYLAIFNQIDKHFDAVLDEDVFVPFNEKIKRIIDGDYAPSWFVHMHHHQLKYFGELRNHITHGIKEHGHTYAYPSEHALRTLETLRDAILTPPCVGDVFAKDVYTCSLSDPLVDVVAAMHTNSYTHIPVYDADHVFYGLLTEGDITGFVASYDGSSNGWHDCVVSDVSLQNSGDAYLFVSAEESIFQVDKVFARKRHEGKRLGAILITKNGKKNDPLLGLITAGDVSLIDEFIVH